ncbi:MAG: IS630 family transposase, partial [Trichodesmium sp. St11_bin5]|nr:IS630 family transposase [Trichodesmium sp. St11_bin5]
MLVATDIIVRITDLRKRQKMNIIDELNDFINQTKESKEIKR